MKISRVEFERIKDLKKIDLQQCSFCHEITILNLGWEPFLKLLCQACQEEHVLCPDLCLKVAKNIFDCHLYQELPRVGLIKEVKANKPHDLANCYCCGKELKGAGKTGKIKNRNNPGFWGISIEYRILCLTCIGKKFYSVLSPSKRRTFNKYLQRGYE
jgi:hypothetical protein